MNLRDLTPTERKFLHDAWERYMQRRAASAEAACKAMQEYRDTLQKASICSTLAGYKKEIP